MTYVTKRRENIVAREHVALRFSRVMTPCNRLSKSHYS